MSRNDWERGTLTLPARAWKPLRDAMAKAECERQTALLKCAQQVHALLVEVKKTAKRGTFSVFPAFNALSESGQHRALFEQMRALHGDYEVLRSLQSDKDARQLVVPKKKDFPFPPATKLQSLRIGYEGRLTFNHEKRQVTWDTNENNHAVEEARDSYHGRRFFALLARIDWTRGTGGVLVGNDEYNEDNDGPGEGGNYITAAYGPLGKREKELQSGVGMLRRRRVRKF